MPMPESAPKIVQPTAVHVAKLNLSDFYFQKTRFAQQLGETLATTGFCIIRNHYVAMSIIEAAFAASREVFDLPEVAKHRYVRSDIHHQRGYIPMKVEQHPGHAPDHKEMWHVGVESEYPNVWPSEAPGFRASMMELHRSMDMCGQMLLKACATYLGEPEDTFAALAVGGRSLLRTIHYPPMAHVEQAGANAQWGATHTDINFLTLLVADKPGLQVKTRDGVWVDVNAGEGEIVVNVADMLQNMTNGVFLSGEHRVVHPPGAAFSRYSIPFFIHPYASADLSPLSACVQRTGGPDRRFRKITAKDYLDERLKEIALATKS